MEAIAFYLPQFHVIPENEAIYGKGFTEWDNVKKAGSLFPGHYQPHVPHHSIGLYSLLDEEFIEKQHALAWENGVRSFCYYYYNMGGKPLLDRPLRLINRNATIRNKFCLCWDHFSWYNNSWLDSHEPELKVFIEQEYSIEKAILTFRDMVPYLENERYIRIDGRPFIAVFSPKRHPMICEYMRVWRKEALAHGFPGLWLAGVESYSDKRPASYGLNSWIEFAPQWRNETLVAPDRLNPRCLDYLKTLKIMIGQDVPRFIRSRCAFPSWDNTPRRGDRGVVIQNDHPELYKTYLECLCEYTRDYLPRNMQYVFINAWNEWGEGCHLEPDMKHGHAWLDATREVLAKFN